MGAVRLSGLSECAGASALLTSDADLAAYSYDGALERGRPDAVVLARGAPEARRVVGWCAANGVPFTARGAGTNLSGGCVPLRGGIVLSLARMDRILSIEPAAGIASVEPGVVNLELQRALERLGRFYAPDPASYRVCTIGGNVAENAGGPRCLKYGVTANHVLAVEAVMPDGSTARFSADDEGPDLLGLLVGAEGTLGVVTKVWVRTMPRPETVLTLLAAFGSVDAAVECVCGVIAAGILPRVLEAMDRATVESVEAYQSSGYPSAEAVLLIELDGPAGLVAAQAGEVERLCRSHGCSSLRRAGDEAERERLWEGRRGAYAAVARIAPNVLVEDGVVPRGRLPEACRRVRRIASGHGARVAMLFHAGDGNLHPNIAFDERDAEETRRVKAAGFEMLRACVELGGSISGEHGIGSDKRRAMAWLFTPETLGLFRRIKRTFDPENISNPDKLIPLPEEAQAERGLHPSPRPGSEAVRELVERVRELASRGALVNLVGACSKLPRGRLTPGAVVLDTRKLTAIVDLDRANYTATIEAGVEPASLRSRLEAEGVHAPLPPVGGTLGGLLAAKGWTPLRDHVLGMRALLVSGEVVDLGGKVVKNVAGYDAAKALLGSWGCLAAILEVTLKLYPYPTDAPGRLPPPRPFKPNKWHRLLKAAFDPENRLNPWVFGAQDDG